MITSKIGVKMASQEEFYRTHYAKDQPLKLSDKYEKAYLIFKDNNISRILDIGCGDGRFCLMLKKRLRTQDVVGIDIPEEAIRSASEKGVSAYRLNVGDEKLPFTDGFFDGVFCGEVIEHVYDTDQLLDEIFRVLSKKGKCILTTPNLASWYNRIFLLLGYQPIFTEVSLKHAVGHMFPLGAGRAGHIRLFTLRALVELVRIHNFKIDSIIFFGINTNIGFGKKWGVFVSIANKLLGKTPSLCSDIMIVLSK